MTKEAEMLAVGDTVQQTKCCPLGKLERIVDDQAYIRGENWACWVPLLSLSRAAARPSPDTGLVEREAVKNLIEVHRQLGVEYEAMHEAQPNNHQNKMMLAGKRNSIQGAINILIAASTRAVAGEPVAFDPMSIDDVEMRALLSCKDVGSGRQMLKRLLRPAPDAGLVERLRDIIAPSEIGVSPIPKSVMGKINDVLALFSTRAVAGEPVAAEYDRLVPDNPPIVTCEACGNYGEVDGKPCPKCAISAPSGRDPGNTRLRFDYVNYSGKAARRFVEFICVRFGTSEYHKTPQFLMRAHDIDRDEEREFALADMNNIEKV